jgi:hypothetical protein
MFTQKKKSWKAALTLTEKGPKTARQMKSTKDRKEKIAYSNFG